MDAAPPPLDVLLAHGAFVRAAVRGVLGGDAEVEDVVQETWLQALHTGPREPGALRSWLRRVARNLAIDAWRRRARRARHEAAAARPEGLPSVHEIAEREEARRRLVAAILGLEEPSRSALLLRWYEELPVADVARRLGVPVETARTRLRRGLERLRERLGARDGPERRAWAVALAPWAAPSRGSAVPAALGGLAVKKVLVAVAALLLALAGGYVVLRAPPEAVQVPASRETARAAPPPPAPAADLPAPPSPPPPDPEPVRATLAVAPPPPDVVPRRTPFAAGVVVDEDGTPISGVAVVPRALEVLPWGETQDEGLDAEIRERPAARTDETGRFEVADPVRDQISLVFLKDGYAAFEVRGLATEPSGSQEVRVTLRTGLRFACNVNDTDGRPIEGAHLIFWAKPDSSGRILFGDATTDERGRCVLGWLSTPLSQLSVTQWGYDRRELKAPALRDEETIVLRRKEPMFVVMDSESGSPLPGAAGLLYPASDGPFVCVLTTVPRDHGAFHGVIGRLSPSPWPPLRSMKTGSFRAVVWASSHESREVPVNLPADGEPPRVEVRLTAGEVTPAIQGAVVPASGTALEVRVPMPRGWLELPIVVRVAPEADGSFAVTGLPAGDYVLTATAVGFAPASVKVRAPARGVQVALEREAVLDVVVRDVAGAPAARAPVTVWVEGAQRVVTLFTDTAGSVRFEGLPRGKAHVAPARVSPGWEWGSLPSHPTVDLDALKAAHAALVRPTARLRTIRLRDEGGVTVSDAALRLRIRGGWAQFYDEFNRLKAWTSQTDANGESTVELVAGQYELEAVKGATRRKFNIEVSEEAPVIDVVWR